MCIIERVEDGYAVIENGGGVLTVPVSELYENASAGDVLKKTVDGYEKDISATYDRKKYMQELLKKVMGE